MFIHNEFYKHRDGRDAVVMVLHSQQYSHGYEVMISWHILNYYGQPGPTDLVYTVFISNDHLDDWRLYEVPKV